MNDQHLDRVRALFAQAVDLPREDRIAFLDDACVGGPELRAELNDLLNYDEDTEGREHEESFLKSPILRPDLTTPSDGQIARRGEERSLPTRIGRYRIVRWHGERGMATVYEAEQDSPRRTVALKVIRSGFPTREMDYRFQHEAQILARLQHIGIAQVYEADMSEDGHPFFAMEFIRGVPLDEFVRSRGLGASECLELLAQVCDAVQHAHDRGVVHRDLKPVNVLVDASGQPKILDFGVARVTDADLRTTLSQTRTGQLLGTLSYMSPEQLSAQPSVLDARSDVYALGVKIFELLAHRLPYQLDELPVHEVARVIGQQEPSRLGSIDRRYRGDLEVIVAKALEKKKTARYASAADLASDIRRYLRGEPIRARKVSTAERSWRWARRNSVVALLACALSTVLLLATGGSLLTARRIARAALEERALREEADSARDAAAARERAERWERYRSSIAAASAAQQLQNSSTGGQALEAAPEEHRNWEWRHLHSLLEGASFVFPVPPGRTGPRAMSPNSPQIAVVGRDGNALLYDAATGRRGPVLESDPGEVIYLEFSPDGRRLAIGAKDGTIRICEVATGRQQLVMRGEKGATLRFSHDGRRIISNEAAVEPGNGKYRLWDAATGRQLAVLGEGRFNGYNSGPVFSPDGKRAATAEGELIRISDADTGRQLSAAGPLGLQVDRVFFSPNGKRMIVGQAFLFDSDTGLRIAVLGDPKSADWFLAWGARGSRLATCAKYPKNSVRLWDASTGQLIRTMPGHTNAVMGLAFSPDEKRLASISSDQTARLWDGESGQLIAVLRGHSGRLTSVAFNPDGTRLVTSSYDRTMRLWDAKTGELITVLRGHRDAAMSPAYSFDGSRLISSSTDGTVRVWDMNLVERNVGLRWHESFVYDVAFRPDGAQVASAAWDATVRLWNPETGEQTGILRSDSAIISSVAYSSDGTRIATAARDLGVTLWNVATAKQEHTWPGPTGTWRSDGRVAFSSDGTLIAAGSAAGPVRLWRVSTKERIAELAGHDEACGDVAFSPDGKILASAGLDGTIRLWDVATHKAGAILRGHTARVTRIAFSPDGMLVASGSEDSTLRFWSSRTQSPVSKIDVGSMVHGLAFSPDGTRLAIGCADTTLRLIDVKTRQEVAELRGHADYVHAVAWSPDGTRLVSGSGDRSIRIWDSLSMESRAHAARRKPTD
jgi:WD40 repeat protein/predicted Ser/Thr protein kinase